MKKILILIPVLLLSLTGCDNTNDPEEKVKNEITVKVYDISTWNASTNKTDTTVGATVNLISGSDTLKATTGNNGTVTFSNVKEDDYNIIAEMGNKCNLINKTFVNNITIGYLVTGVYTSEEEIQNSPRNNSAFVGGPKSDDQNGDGIINNNDKIAGQSCSYEYKYLDVNGDDTIDVKDLINGSLVKTDNQVKVSIYISNINY